MGCLESKEKAPKEQPATELPQSQPKTVDPRLPFDNYRQLFNLRNSWKTVGRNLTDTAKECLIRYFRKYPQHKEWYRGVGNLDDEEKMRASTSFENAAIGIFNLFDDVMENSEKVDVAIASIQMAAEPHKKIKGFHTDYLKDMEGPFIEAVGATLGDRFTEPTEQNFRKLYQFVVQEMIKSLGGETPGVPPEKEAKTEPEKEAKKEPENEAEKLAENAEDKPLEEEKPADPDDLQIKL